MTEYLISNYETIDALLKSYLDEEPTEKITLKFEHFETKPFLRVTGPSYNGTFNSEVMDVLLLNQKKINQIYSLLLYGKVKKLNNKETQEVRLQYTVSPGSSITEIVNNEEVLKKIIDKISGKQILFSVIIIAVSVVAYHLGGKFIDYKESNERDKNLLEAIGKLSESHSRDIEKILKTENEKFNKILTLSKKAESVEFSGIQVKSDAIESISTKTTQKQLNADYRILKIGVEADGSFSVRLEDIKTGFKFNARIDDIISHPEELAKLNKVFLSVMSHISISMRCLMKMN